MKLYNPQTEQKTTNLTRSNKQKKRWDKLINKKVEEYLQKNGQLLKRFDFFFNIKFKHTTNKQKNIKQRLLRISKGTSENILIIFIFFYFHVFFTTLLSIKKYKCKIANFIYETWEDKNKQRKFRKRIIVIKINFFPRCWW